MALEDGADLLPSAEAEFRAKDQLQGQMLAQQANLTRERDLARQKANTSAGHWNNWPAASKHCNAS
jgi:hypothetical protein